MTGPNDSAFASTGSNTGLTAKEYSCILLMVPNSGTAWLDAIIQKAREQKFKVLLASAFSSAVIRDNQSTSRNATQVYEISSLLYNSIINNTE